MTAQGPLLSSTRCVRCAVMRLPARSIAQSGFDQGRDRTVNTACPQAIRQRMPERYHALKVTRVLLAAIGSGVSRGGQQDPGDLQRMKR